jgi:FkbM family methyltransferase
MAVVKLDYHGAPKPLLLDVTEDIEVQLRANACAKEPWTVAFIEAIPSPDATFWDIGANVGPYTLVAASRGLRVVAVEPYSANYAKLCRNLTLNGMLDRVLTMPVALGQLPDGASVGFGWLHLSDLRAGSAFHRLSGERKTTHHHQQVQVWTLEALAFCTGLPGPHYLKIDVDGSELDVLAGASALLANPDVRGIMIEVARPLEAQVMAVLTAAGFALAARHHEREGREIADIVYLHFVRP